MKSMIECAGEHAMSCALNAPKAGDFRNWSSTSAGTVSRAAPCWSTTSCNRRTAQRTRTPTREGGFAGASAWVGYTPRPFRTASTGAAVAVFLQVLITGLAAGAGYGLVAIAFSLIYRLTGVVHFALGELIGLAVFVTLYAAAGTVPVSATNVSGGRYVLAILAGLAVTVAGGVVVYLLAVRPFTRRGLVLGWIGATTAVAFAVHGYLAAAFTRPAYVFPDPIPFHRFGHAGVLQLGGGVSV